MDTFKEPVIEQRGAPLWCWNNKLNREQLLRQVDYLRQMGFGGFFIHVRVGLETEYMGDEFLDLVKACIDRAKELGMKAHLYDEDRWPSGAAGGLVTTNKEFRATHVLFTPFKYGDKRASKKLLGGANAKPSRSENGELLATFELELNEDGYLISYKTNNARELGEAEGSKKVIWYAYMETALPSEWYNKQTYVDTMNKKATQRFLEVTHEKYRERVESEFGKTISYMFTDEPQIPHKSSLKFATRPEDVFMPWSSDFQKTFKETYRVDIVAHLPELFFELASPDLSQIRYWFHDHACERFCSGFLDEVASWCSNNGLSLTGHVMPEPTLLSQSSAMGEAMRTYRAFAHPGIDILQDKMELTTAKQAQSVARQMGRKGTLCEMYGVTNWTFDFSGHKRQGDWLAALGVTLRCPHLSLVSLAGEAKRDFPSSINYQSPWYKDYPIIEDHFARVNAILTRGKPLARVAVVHPVESYWLFFGPLDQTYFKRNELDSCFHSITERLLKGLIDFDFVCESLIQSNHTPYSIDSGKLKVGVSTYDVLLLPVMTTIRSSTLQMVKEFERSGGKVIFFGQSPRYVDGRRSDESLEPYREISVWLSSGKPTSVLLHQIHMSLFCNTDGSQHGAEERHDIYERLDDCEIRFSGHWSVTELDTMTGKISDIPTLIEGGTTKIVRTVPSAGSLLLKLSPGSKRTSPPERKVVSKTKLTYECDIRTPTTFTLSMPNVALLDMAQYQLGCTEWSTVEEILRIDNTLRAQLGLPLKGQQFAQPWSDYKFNRDIDLPTLAAGVHILILEIPYGLRTNLERIYILGNFGVTVKGAEIEISEYPQSLYWGDWAFQKLPFYTGTVTYESSFELKKDGHVALEIPHFKAPLIKVSVDDKHYEPLAFPPFQLDLGFLLTGKHVARLEVFANNQNPFGAIHMPNSELKYFSPGVWRSSGFNWSYEYVTSTMGILTAPKIYSVENASSTEILTQFE
ncbi:hypothetical protein V1511DRAFT_520156 [Dipodascopsis uninucleata]